MKVQVPEAVDVLALVTADFASLIAMLSNLSSRTVNRPAASSLEQSMAFHAAQQRKIGRHRPGLRLLFYQHDQVVEMQLITPIGMLPMLLSH